MSPARRAARAGRNLLVAVIVGGLIIVAVVAAYIAGRGATGPSAQETSPQASNSTSADTPSAAANDPAPTGCLGGQERSSAMLLAAQSSAPRTTYGAVEVAVAFYRWTYRYPVPSSSDITQSRPIFVPSQAKKAEASLSAGYARNPNPSTGTISDGKPFHLSTVGGRWVAQPIGSIERVLVSVEAPYEVGGAISATKTATASFQMRWVGGGWRVAGLAKGDPAKLIAGGTAFTAGC